MARLKLNPDPTFFSKVEVPVPGGTAEVGCTFKYRDREDLAKWVEATKDAGDAEVLIDCMSGWDLDDEFNAESAKRLCSSYPGASYAIVARYVRELAGIRQGN